MFNGPVGVEGESAIGRGVQRGRPEALLACVLYGRELGLGPMESLNSIAVIDGRPSPSAEL